MSSHPRQAQDQLLAATSAALLAAALTALFAALWFIVPLVHLVWHRRT